MNIKIEKPQQVIAPAAASKRTNEQRTKWEKKLPTSSCKQRAHQSCASAGYRADSVYILI